MPLTSKGHEILKSMQQHYGSKEKAEQVLYASENKGTITGIHSQLDDDCAGKMKAIHDSMDRLCARVDAYCAKADADDKSEAEKWEAEASAAEKLASQHAKSGNWREAQTQRDYYRFCQQKADYHLGRVKGAR